MSEITVIVLAMIFVGLFVAWPIKIVTDAALSIYRKPPPVFRGWLMWLGVFGFAAVAGINLGAIVAFVVSELA